MTCPLFCEFSIALIAKELYSAFCFLVLLKNTHVNNFYSIFVQFVFECRFFSSLNFVGICGGSGFTIFVLAV